MNTKQIENLIRHIQHVQEGTLILGRKLIANGEHDLGRRLIANGFIHDNSKFYGIESDHLHNTDEDAVSAWAEAGMRYAIDHHSRTNMHHPEYWGSIHKMPPVYVAEMVCDWKARSNEFSSSLQDWIDEVATKRWGFTKEDEVYSLISKFINLLVDKPFKPLK